MLNMIRSNHLVLLQERIVHGSIRMQVLQLVEVVIQHEMYHDYDHRLIEIFYRLNRLLGMLQVCR
jgi:hypothetical protein